MADQAQDAPAGRAFIQQSSPPGNDVEMQDAPADEDIAADADGDVDADADEDAEGEIDADGEADADGELDAAPATSAPGKLDQETTDKLFDLVLFLQDYKEDEYVKPLFWLCASESVSVQGLANSTFA